MTNFCHVHKCNCSAAMIHFLIMIQNLIYLGTQPNTSNLHSYSVFCYNERCPFFVNPVILLLIKMITDRNIIKENTTALTTTTAFFKCYKNSILCYAQKTRNRIPELLDFKFFWGHDPRPPWGKVQPL